MKIDTGRERPRNPADFMRMSVLHVRAFLESGIVLPECITVHGVVEEIREVGVEIEKRPSQEAVDFQRVAIRKRLAVIAGERSKFHSAAVGRVHISKPIDHAGRDQIEQDLAGGIKVISPEDEPETDLLRVIE